MIKIHNFNQNIMANSQKNDFWESWNRLDEEFCFSLVQVQAQNSDHHKS